MANIRLYRRLAFVLAGLLVGCGESGGPRPPAITQNPQDQLATIGGSVTFTVVASGSGTLSYQWQRSDDNGSSWQDVPGATSSSYTLSGVQSSDDGALFRCVVTSEYGSATSNAAAVVISPPVVTAHPQNLTVLDGQSASFSVTASGSGTLSYQWQRSNDNGSSWQDISGATSSSYTLTGAKLSDSGARFRCAVVNLAGSVVSNPATLTVNPAPPAIVTHPQNVTVKEGQDAVFSVTATGSAPLSYKWERSNDNGSSWQEISGATSSSYTLTGAQLSDSGARFRCAVTNSAGTATSDAATLTVNPAPPAISTHPQNVTVKEGQDATFSVTATGSVPLSYQWQRSNDNGSSWQDISGATSSSYTLTSAQLSDSGARFRCRVTNSAGSATSSAAVITVRHNFVRFASGGDHTSAVKGDGTVWAWGWNVHGQLGDGTTTSRRTPVQVKGVGGSGTLGGIDAVAAGYTHTLALGSNGKVYAWGGNVYGQLGDGTTTPRQTPVEVLGLSGVEAIAAGEYHSVALKTDGTVWAWGYNGLGQLGDGTATNSRSTPVQVKGPGGTGYLQGVEAIAAGYYHTLALKSDGTVWAWGGNASGQLGDGSTTDSTTPVQVKGPGGTGYLSGIIAIAAEGYHSLALRNDGTVWAWGHNGFGQLGDGTTTNRNTPVQVKGPGGTGYLTGVEAIAAGHHHSIACKSDGSVWTWGRNNYGQLGDGTFTPSTAPVRVKGAGGSGNLSAIEVVEAGRYHTLAQDATGTTWTWGRNEFGQLGDGTLTDRLTPVAVSSAP